MLFSTVKKYIMHSVYAIAHKRLIKYINDIDGGHEFHIAVNDIHLWYYRKSKWMPPGLFHWMDSEHAMSMQINIIFDDLKNTTYRDTEM